MAPPGVAMARSPSRRPRPGGVGGEKTWQKGRRQASSAAADKNTLAIALPVPPALFVGALAREYAAAHQRGPHAEQGGGGLNEGARTPGRGGSSRLQPVPTGRETKKKKEQEGNAGSTAATGGGRKAPRSERGAAEGRERGEAARTAVVRGGLATGAATKARGNGASRSVTRTIPLRTYNWV